jgi:hypothetical protein
MAFETLVGIAALTKRTLVLPNPSRLDHASGSALYSEHDVLDIVRLRRSIDVVTAAEFKETNGCDSLGHHDLDSKMTGFSNNLETMKTTAAWARNHAKLPGCAALTEAVLFMQMRSELSIRTQNSDLLKREDLRAIDVWHVPERLFRLERFECFFSPFPACDAQIAIDAIFNGIAFQPLLAEHTAALMMEKGITGVGKYDAFHWRRGDFAQWQNEPVYQKYIFNGTWSAEQVLKSIRLNSATILPMILLTPDDSNLKAVVDFKRAYPAPVVQLSTGCPSGDCGAQGDSLMLTIADELAGLGARTFIGSSLSTFSNYIIKLRNKARTAKIDSPLGLMPRAATTLPKDTPINIVSRGHCDWSGRTRWEDISMAEESRAWCPSMEKAGCAQHEPAQHKTWHKHEHKHSHILPSSTSRPSFP